MKMSRTDFLQPDGLDLPPLHRVEDLTDGGNLAQIALGNQVYTLRITRSGKLILTK